MPKTLLLADDSVVIQKLVGLSFANEDVRLVTTDNGDDAVAKARELRPDVILADVVMPGMSGYDVCQAIKGDPQLASTPVLLLTGTFEAFDEERARRVGSNGHITKPFEAQALVDRVNALLAESRNQSMATTAPSSEDAFDFFDEDVRSGGKAGTDVTTTAPAREPARPAAPAPRPGAVGADISDGLGAGQAFDFGDADALPPLEDDGLLDDSLELDAPRRGFAGDRTVALMPDHEPAAASSSRRAATLTSRSFERVGQRDVSDELATTDPDPSLTTIIMSEGNTSSDGISFGDERAARVASLDDSLAAAEPPRRREDSFAVAVDDDLLGDPSSSAPFELGRMRTSSGAPSYEIGEPTPNPAESMLAEDLFEDTTPPVHRSKPAAEPQASPGADDAFDFGSSDPFGGAAADPFAAASSAVTPPLARDYDVSSSDLGAPLAEPAATAPDTIAHEPFDPEPVYANEELSLSEGLLGEPLSGFEATEDEPVADIDPLAETEPGVAGRVGPDISPMMRERIHGTLESIAWEAFADLSDTMVKQVLQRVEAIAWEVIPQMAEALIKEEIRRMKGEDED